MSAAGQTELVRARILAHCGVDVGRRDTATLRRAAQTLHKWGEDCCGWSSWGIARDETTGVPYRCFYPHDGKPTRWRTADREACALRQVEDVCRRNGLHYYHQTDPRGCALYVSRGELTSANYPRGVPCSA